MPPPTKCDIVRAGARAVLSGACAGDAPPLACAVTDAATKRDFLFKTKYDPSGLLTPTDRQVRQKELGIIQDDLAGDEVDMQRKFGLHAPVDISWADFTSCLWNPDGRPGGPHENEYFRREDLTSLGYTPRPLVGGRVFADTAALRPLRGSVPVWLDRFVNPGLAIVLVFAFIVLVFGALLYAAYRSGHAGEAPAANDTSRRAKATAIIHKYEKAGYCMEEYRKKVGLPVTDKCAE